MPALHGTSNQTTVPAVLGEATKFEGVRGTTKAPSHGGVVGLNINTTAGAGPGVLGGSDHGEGVRGESKSNGHGAIVGANSGAGQGVYGESASGEGVRGVGHSTDHGAVVGTNSGAGQGVYGESASGEGVRGVGHSTDHGAVVGTNSGAGQGVYGESASGEGVRGVGHSTDHGAVVGTNDVGVGVFGSSRSGDGVHGETSAEGFLGGVTGVALNANGVATGVLGRSIGAGPGVSGLASTDSGVLGFHGDPRLNETTVGNDGARAGVFGASDVGAGVVGYSRNTASFGVIAFGGIRASTINHPTAGEFNGKVQVNGDMSVTGDIFLQGADCAEHFDITGLAAIEPGCVVVIDDSGALRQSDGAYDRKVAGVISGAGSYRSGLVLDAREQAGDRRAVALMGKVFCKADARFGAITVGDLMTTSDTPGHAMKATDPARAFGAVIGKAMAPLLSGRGLIPILVALQ